jgi:hypothetical protein
MDRKRFRVTTAKAQASTASVGLRAERVVAIDEFAIKRECRAAALGLDGRGSRRSRGLSENPANVPSDKTTNCRLFLSDRIGRRSELSHIDRTEL